MKPTRRELLAAAVILPMTSRAGFAAGLRDVTPQVAYLALQSDPTIIVLDIRTPNEYANGHIEGALNIDYYNSDFAARLQALDPDRTYVLYCQMGARSRAVMRSLVGSSFGDVLHVAQGFAGWRSEGLPFVRR